MRPWPSSSEGRIGPSGPPGCRCWGFVAQRTMWSDFIVVPSPSFDQHSRLLQCVEDFRIQQLVPELAVEALVVAVRRPLRPVFDRGLKLEFHGSRVNSDAGLPAYHELDDSLDLTARASDLLADSRTGKNGWHGVVVCFANRSMVVSSVTNMSGIWEMSAHISPSLVSSIRCVFLSGCLGSECWSDLLIFSRSCRKLS